MYDSVRGFSTTLQSESSAAASTTHGNTVTTSHVDNPTLDGFVYDHGTGSGSTPLNSASHSYVAWGWKAGGVPTADDKRRVNNSSTEITLTTSSSQAKGANTYGKISGSNPFTAVRQSVNSAGDFSITKYTSNTNSGNDFHMCHGLTGTPNLIITKNLDSTPNWAVWHSSLTNLTNGYLKLDTSDVQATTDLWGSTAPNSTSVNFGANGMTNHGSGGTQSFMMYCWKAVAGVSAFGSYTVSGTTGGPKVTLDFRPKFIMVKNINQTSTSCSWVIIDAFRDDWGTSGTVNLGESTALSLYADQTKLENQRAASTSDDLTTPTIYDDGFQFQDDNHKEATSDAGVYIYAAFA